MGIAAFRLVIASVSCLPAGDELSFDANESTFVVRLFSAVWMPLVSPDWSAVRDWEGPERLATVGAHLVVEYQTIAGSALRIEKMLGVTMTQRNWRVFAGLAVKATALAKDS